MKLTIDKMNDVNRTYKEDFMNRHSTNKISLTLKPTANGTELFCNNLRICGIEEINELIEELENMQACIEFETGIIL